MTGTCAGSGLIGKGGWWAEIEAMEAPPLVGGWVRVDFVERGCRFGGTVGPVAGADPYLRMFFFNGQSSLKA